VLDCRAERDPAAGRLVSEDQLAWAVDRIARSDATFVLVVSSVHVTDHADRYAPDDVTGRWQGFPAQREALLAAASSRPGVVFVTGDMHYGGIQWVSPAGALGADQVELAVGPAGAQPWAVSAWLAAHGGVPDQYEALVDTWSVTLLELVPAGVDEGPALRVRYLDDAGRLLVARSFPA
ncbi:MAG: alkaline phosphatase D family protein, partial [Myxococcota bacterium]